MAFDFTCLAPFQANSSAAHSSSVGARRVFTTAAAWSSLASSAVCARYPPEIDFTTSGSPPGATVHLLFFLAVMKILTAKSNRDYLYTAVIAFLELLAAA